MHIWKFITIIMYDYLYMRTFMPEAGILNFDQNEILVFGYWGVWQPVFDKSRYLNGIYLFSYSVLKKGISELGVRLGARRRYLICNIFPFEARLRYLPLAPKNCLSMEVDRRYLPLAHKKSCVMFLLNSVTLRYPPLAPKDLFFMEVTEVTCLWHKHFLALGLEQEADSNI